ncbi:MAG TPA: GNAT family N-acetyltransferase [Tepidisphaeraceae bacterium]|jgi:ribosomal protein S18 acetylase RimI-like enzyme
MTEPHQAELVITPHIDGGAALPFVQQMQYKIDGKTIALARWHAPASDDGVVQLIDLYVEPAHQRQGHGSMMLRTVYKQSIALFHAVGVKPRRLWACVEQKRQVNARAFFSRHGFHHISTASNLYKRQDAMFYTRAFD